MDDPPESFIDVAKARPQYPTRPYKLAKLNPKKFIGHDFRIWLIWLLSLGVCTLLVGWNVLVFKQEIDRSAAYNRMTTLTVESQQTTDIEQAIRSVEAAQHKPPSGAEPLLPQSARALITALIDEASTRPDGPPSLATAMTRCRPALKPDGGDAAKASLDDCLMTLTVLRLQSTHADISPERSRLATELLKQLTQAQEEQRTQWLKVAQMILLNLLLPLLTAVFGYVFGREQAKGESRELRITFVREIIDGDVDPEMISGASSEGIFSTRTIPAGDCIVLDLGSNRTTIKPPRPWDRPGKPPPPPGDDSKIPEGAET